MGPQAQQNAWVQEMPACQYRLEDWGRAGAAQLAIPVTVRKPGPLAQRCERQTLEITYEDLYVLQHGGNGLGPLVRLVRKTSVSPKGHSNNQFIFKISPHLIKVTK